MIIVDEDARNAAADIVCKRLDGGTLEFSNNGVFLGACRFNQQAFEPAIGGAAKARAFLHSAPARATAEATEWVAKDRNGVAIIKGTGDDFPAKVEVFLGGIISIEEFIYQSG